jgi:hypothetical protein
MNHIALDYDEWYFVNHRFFSHIVQLFHHVLPVFLVQFVYVIVVIHLINDHHIDYVNHHHMI